MIRFPRYVIPAILALVALFLFVPGCASLGGVRHVATVTVVTSHGILALTQDTEKSLVCGVATAPAPPACVTASVHRDNSAQLAKAWGYEGDIERLVRAIPAGGVVPPDIATLLGQINSAIDKVLAAIPGSTQKTQLVVAINPSGGK
jgi:hypothetical protein